MGKKHKNKVRVLPGRMYRLVRSDRSVYCDAENALRTCFIEETKEQQAILSETGCDLGQGYYYSRPVELAKLEFLLDGQGVPATPARAD